jgi:hypothetical protein
MDVAYRLSDIDFVWDRKKAQSNLRKHGIAFETASEVFFDPFICLIGTDVVSGEERETVIGMTNDWRLLRVIYIFRSETVRIISARPVTIQERKTYEEQ